MIKVRFAPSPTGFLHIGGARTALFNWMYARAQNGKFVLRIEDTDQERSKTEYLDEIMQSMTWLGLDWDEMYKQSDRFDIYREHAQKLLDAGLAYQDGPAVILKMTPEEVKIFDLIRGEIVFDTSTIKDQVLMKSDGSPTYSFACVVDDALMEISHVIRGEDHISNTPKQIMIYNALGLKVPKFAHLPLIMDTEGGRMSKRTGAVAVTDYRNQGFLPDALVNYLMLLGWSPGNNQEIISLENAVKKFSIKKVNKAAAAFSMEKLKWINTQYLKQADAGRIVDLVAPLMQERGWIDQTYDKDRIAAIVGLYKGRMSTLGEFLEWTVYCFVEDIAIPEEDRAKHLEPPRDKEFALLADRLQTAEPFDAQQTERVFRAAVDELGLKASDLVHPVRVALTGSSIGPGLFETMAVLGKDKTLHRLRTTYVTA